MLLLNTKMNTSYIEGEAAFQSQLENNHGLFKKQIELSNGRLNFQL